MAPLGTPDPVPARHWPRSPWPWVGLGLGLLLTFMVWGVLNRAEGDRLMGLHQSQATVMAKHLEDRVQGLEQVLRGATGYLGRGTLPTREEWQAYVVSLNLPSHAPGVQGMSYVAWVPKGQVKAHEAAIRAEGFPDYAVMPGGTLPTDPDGFGVVHYIEPMDARNQRAFGKDMLVDPLRREALLAARDHGLVTISAPITLYQETESDPQVGTVLYAPVYLQGVPQGSVTERRKAFRGWAAIPLRMRDLVEATLARDLRTMDLQLVDATPSGPERPLFASAPDPSPTREHAVTRPFVVGGRTWIARIAPNATFFMEAGRRIHWEVLASGVAGSLLLFALLMLMQGAERRADLLARQREAELVATELRFRALFESAPLGMAIVDTLSGRFLSVNPRLGDILGYPAEEILGKRFQQFTHPDHLAADLASVQQLAAGAVSEVHKEKRYLHRDGHEVWGRLRMVRLPGTPGGLMRHLALVEDITEARLRQAEFQNSETRFRALFDLSPDPITLSRLSDGTLLMANATWCELTGLSLEQAIGRSPATLGAWPQREARESLLAELREVGTIVQREAVLRHQDGTERQVVLTGRVLRLEGEDLVLVAGKDVTLRHRAEAQFRALFEKNRAVKLIVDPADGRIVAANPAAVAYYGYEHDALLGLRIHDLNCLGPIEVQAEMASARQEDRSCFRFTHRLASGELRQVEVYSSPIEWEGLSCLVSIVHDVTDRNEIEIALRQSEARFRSLFNLLPVGVTVTDDQGRILASNPASEAMLGIPADDLVRRDFKGPDWDIIRPDGSPMPPGEYASVRAFEERRRVADVEMGVRRPDGQVAWILVTAEPVAIQGMGVVIVYRDITERRLAEQQLVTSEARWQFALEGAGEGVWDWNAGSEVMFLSRGYRSMLGYDADEDLGTSFAHWIERLHPEDREPILEAVDAYLEQRSQVYQTEGRIRRKDGSYIWVLSRGMAATRDDSGRPTRMIGTMADITAAKEAEAALRQSEGRLRILADHLPDSFLYQLLAAPGQAPRFIYLSEGVERLCGISREAALQDPSLLFGQMDPEMVPAYREAEAASGRDLLPFAMDFRNRRADGVWRWLRVRSAPNRQPDGNVVWEGITTDITEAKINQLQLEESEIRFRGLFELSPDPISLTRLSDGALIEVNQAWCGLTGLSREEVLGCSTRELGPWADPGEREAFQRALADTGRFGPKDIRVKDRQGQVHQVVMTSRVMLIHGEPHFLSMSKDLSDRLVAERALMESEAKFRGVVEQAAQSIYIHDEQGCLLMCNPEACRSTGYTQGELLGMRVQDLDLDYHPERDASVWQTLKPGDQVTLHGRHRRKDGTSFPVEIRLGLLSPESPRQLLALVRDLTGQEQATQADLRARKAESLVLMAGSIAHDFNNLFQGVLGYMEVAMMRAEGQPSLIQTLQKAEDTLRKAIGLSWKMLDFSGRGLLHPERLDLEAWLPSLLADLHLSLPTDFHLDLACENVPFVQADVAKLEEVVRALVDNACEAASGANGWVRLRLWADFGEDRMKVGAPGFWPLARPEGPATVCLEVQDNGPGVPADTLGLICDPFYTTKEIGRGLGLAATVGILNAHRAGLHILNREGGGLILRMHFPPGGA